MRLCGSGGVLVLLLLSVASPANAQDNRSRERVSFPEQGFSIAIPAGWQEIPDSLIQARAATNPPPPGVRDLAGFRPIPGDWFTPPYLMVKAQDTGPVEPAELERLALDPSRRLALLQWLNLLEKTYGVRYDPALFGWSPADRIMWVAASGPSEPFPDVISVAGAVVYPRGVVLVAYRVFPSMDLVLVRNTVRDILLSVQLGE